MKMNFHQGRRSRASLTSTLLAGLATVAAPWP
jgi:hypothetical protein